MSIEKLRRRWNDATRARAVPWAWAWRGVARQAGGVRDVPSQPDGRDRKGFSTSFLMRRVAICAEALQLLASAASAPFPLLAFGLRENPYIRPRLVILRVTEHN
jgi:hypothetical protein